MLAVMCFRYVCYCQGTMCVATLPIDLNLFVASNTIHVGIFGYGFFALPFHGELVRGAGLSINHSLAARILFANMLARFCSLISFKAL